VVAFNYSPDNPLRQTFDQIALDMTHDQVEAYWIDRRIRGQGLASHSARETKARRTQSRSCSQSQKSPLLIPMHTPVPGFTHAIPGQVAIGQPACS
jgi:hypothetical protein